MAPPAEMVVLDLVSDDWYALWEVDYELQRKAPDIDEAGRRRLTASLLHRGLVELRAASELAALTSASSLAGSDVDDALATDANWAVPTSRSLIFAVSLTPEGEAERLGRR